MSALFKSRQSHSVRMFESSYFSKEAHIVIIFIYIMATLINFCGNYLVWRAVMRNKKLQTPMNYLLLNLSLADMVCGASVYPFLFISDVGKIFTHPGKQAFLCMVTEGLGFFFIASGVSIFTLSGISYNRFVAVKYPLKRNLRMTRRSTIVFSTLAWVICTAIMIPSLRSFRYESKLTSCIRRWLPINGTVYRLFLLFAGTIVPTVSLSMS